MIKSVKYYILLLLKKYFASYGGVPLAAWQGIIVSFVESTLIGICYFLSLYFVNNLGIQIHQAGLLISFYGVGTIFGSLAAGKLSDRYSPNKVSIASLFIQSFVFYGLIHAQSISTLALLLFMLGIGSYGFITSNHAWTLAKCRESEAQRLQAINLLGIASNLGLGLSAIIIGLFSTDRFPIIFSSSSFLLLLTGLYLIVIEKYQPSNKIVAHAISSCADTLPHKPSHTNTTIIKFTLLCLFLSGIIISQTNSNYSLYLQQLFPEMGMKSFSLLFALNTFIVVFLQAPIITLFNQLNKIILIGVGAFLLGLGMLILSFSYIYMIAIFACIVMTLGEILFFSFSQLVCYENVNEEIKGSGLGLYRMTFAASRIVGPLLGGIVFQKFGGNILWYLCALFGFICLIPALHFKKYNPAY